MSGTASVPGQLAAGRWSPWIRHYPATAGVGATVVLPHAGGVAAGYVDLARCLSAAGDVYLMQYPARHERRHEPPALTVPALAGDLFEAADWARLGPLRLFGHSMGAVVAFEFARVAERHGVTVSTLWASAAASPSAVAAMPALPTTDAAIIADLAERGGTEPGLLDDQEFVELMLPAIRGDYRAINRYTCPAGTRVTCPIHAVGGADDDRVDAATMAHWREHTDGPFAMTQFPGGHFYLTEHRDRIVALIAAADGAR